MAGEPGDKEALIDKRNEEEPSLPSQASSQLAVYPMRWWICFIFSALGVLQSAQWNFYSPISKNAEAIYGWTDGIVSWLTNSAGIVFTITVSVWSGIIDTKGVRLATIISCSCVFLAACLRCLPCATSFFVYPAFASMIFNGLSAPPIGLAPPIISAAWFPVSLHPHLHSFPEACPVVEVDERGTATALMTTANYLGQAVGFMANNLAVPSMPGNHTELDVDQRHGDLKRLYYTEAIVALVILASAGVYFPSKPPLAPAVSALQSKTDFCEGMGQLVRLKNFWILVTAFGVPSDQSNAAYMGCFSVVGGVLAGILVGRISDRFRRRLKQLILYMYVGASLSFFWFSLMCTRILPYSLPLLYVAVILGGLFINGTIPLFYELAVETTYPIAEGSTTGFLVLLQNLFQSCFLAVPVDNVGTAWMNWTLAGVVPLAIAWLLLFEEKYERSAVDSPSEPCSLVSSTGVTTAGRSPQ